MILELGVLSYICLQIQIFGGQGNNPFRLGNYQNILFRLFNIQSLIFFINIQPCKFLIPFRIFFSSSKGKDQD